VSPDERNTEKSGSSTVTVQRFPGNRTVVRVNCELVGDVTLAMQRCVTDELKRSPGLVVIDLSTVFRWRRSRRAGLGCGDRRGVRHPVLFDGRGPRSGSGCTGHDAANRPV
jgi:hypothetical protein